LLVATQHLTSIQKIIVFLANFIEYGVGHSSYNYRQIVRVYTKNMHSLVHVTSIMKKIEKDKKRKKIMYLVRRPIKKEQKAKGFFHM